MTVKDTAFVTIRWQPATFFGSNEEDDAMKIVGKTALLAQYQVKIL